MAWYDEDSWLTQALSPNLSTILITLAVALFLPILLHTFLYRKAASATGLPAFLLVGPSGGGKTAFTTLVRCCRVRRVQATWGRMSSIDRLCMLTPPPD